MKRKITFTFEIDTAEYYGCEDSDAAVLELVEDMIRPLPCADLPDRDEITIVIEKVD